MKAKILFSIISIVSVLGVSSAQAAFSIEELHAATKAAVDDFKVDHKEHVAHFTGYKSWKSGEESKVKVYVTHDGAAMDFNYLCHKHDAEIQCHAQ